MIATHTQKSVKLLADAEVSEDIVENGVTCDVGSGDFSNGRDRTTKVGCQ